MNSSTFSLLALLVQIVYLIILGCSIYGFILFVKVARRGIKALDIYINEKSND